MSVLETNTSTTKLSWMSLLYSKIWRNKNEKKCLFLSLFTESCNWKSGSPFSISIWVTLAAARKQR